MNELEVFALSLCVVLLLFYSVFLVISHLGVQGLGGEFVSLLSLLIEH